MKTILTTLLILGFALSVVQGDDEPNSKPRRDRQPKFAAAAFADLITPVGVIASGRMSDPENMIDESGMRVSGNRNDYRNWSSLPGRNETWHETDWFATTHSPGPWTMLDLGSVCDLETISIWNANPGSNSDYRFRTIPYGLTCPIDSLQMRSRDLLKLGLLVQNAGVWNGQRLLSAEYIEAATSPHVRKPRADRSHGYFWALPDVSVNGAPTKVIMKHGVFGQTIYVVPEYGLVVIFTAGGQDVQKKGANEPLELRLMLQQDIIPALVSKKKKATK